MPRNIALIVTDMLNDFVHGALTDATNAFTAEDRAHGLDYIEKIYGAELVTSEQLLAGWEEASE